jgi:hypothetical protein
MIRYFNVFNQHIILSQNLVQTVRQHRVLDSCVSTEQSDCHKNELKITLTVNVAMVRFPVLLCMGLSPVTSVLWTHLADHVHLHVNVVIDTATDLISKEHFSS